MNICGVADAVKKRMKLNVHRPVMTLCVNICCPQRMRPDAAVHLTNIRSDSQRSLMPWVLPFFKINSKSMFVFAHVRHLLASSPDRLTRTRTS